MYDTILRITINLIFWGIFLAFIWVVVWNATKKAAFHAGERVRYFRGYTLIHRSILEEKDAQIRALQNNLDYYLAHPPRREKGGQLSLFHEVKKENGQRIPITIINRDTGQPETWSLPYKEYRLYQQGKVKVKRPTGKRRNGLPEYNYIWIDESEIQPKDILLDNYTAFDWRLEGEKGQISSN